MSNFQTNPISRRHFLGTSLLGAAGMSFLPGFAFSNGSPGETVNLGVIGLGRQALGLINNFLQIPGVQILAGSDVYGVKRQRFEKRLNKHYQDQKKKTKIKTYENYKDLLSRKDIDAVIIATPDHWHALMAIDACKAGKDIYLEKPLTFTIKEGQELVKAVRQHKRILAVGSQQRSDREFQHAVSLIREGKIGNIERINAHVGEPPQPYDLPEENVPKDLNWDMWLGPSPYIHYNAKLNPPIVLDPVQDEQWWGAWRWYSELGGGFTTDWGAHMFDIAQWALDKDQSGPIEIIPASYQDYDYLTFKYENGVVMTERPYNEAKTKGLKFWGSNGWIEVSRGNFNASDPSLNLPKIDGKEAAGRQSHHANFIEALKSRKDPIVPVEIGHRTCTVCTLGNIAHQLNKPIKWDPQQESFINDVEAQNHLHRTYRKGYSLI